MGLGDLEMDLETTQTHNEEGDVVVVASLGENVDEGQMRKRTLRVCIERSHDNSSW